MDNGSECFAPAIFRTIVDHSDEPIGITDDSQHFVYTNAAVKELLGYDSIIGFTIADILSEDETIYLHPQTLETGQKLHRNVFFKHKDGRTFECEITGIPYHDGEKQYVVFRVNKIEVQVKKELKVARELYSKLFEHIPDAILIHQEGRIIHANPSAHRLLKSDETHPLLGTQIMDRIHPDFRPLAYERMAQITDAPGNLAPPLEEELIALDGSSFYGEVLATSLRIEEKTIYLVMIRDITSEKHYKDKLESLNHDLEQQIEAELKQRREQEQLLIQQSKLASMGEMIGAIAHQWRQPLNALGLNIQDIVDAKNHGELDDAYLQDIVTRSMKQVNYMSTTIDDFRGYFRSSKEKKPFSLSKALDDVLNILSAQLKHHRIDAEVDFNDTPKDTQVCGYENEIKQVLINIINNAKDAIDETGRENGTIRIKLETAPGEVSIAICDDGCGVDDTIKEKIFDPYFTTKEQGKGTGIGLYMSKTLIEQNMNGRLELAKEPDTTCFKITLPLKENDADL